MTATAFRGPGSILEEEHRELEDPEPPDMARRRRPVDGPDGLPGPTLGNRRDVTFDPVPLALTALIMSTLSLMAIVGYGVKKLVDRPPATHGKEVTNVEAIFGRPPLPEDTVPILPPGAYHPTRNR